MYGDIDGISSDVVTLSKPSWTQTYNNALDSVSSHDDIQLVPKLRRQVVFPNAAMLALLIILRIVWYFVGKPVISVLRYVLLPALVSLHWFCYVFGVVA